MNWMLKFYEFFGEYGDKQERLSVRRFTLDSETGDIHYSEYGDDEKVIPFNSRSESWEVEGYSYPFMEVFSN